MVMTIECSFFFYTHSCLFPPREPVGWFYKGLHWKDGNKGEFPGDAHQGVERKNDLKTAAGELSLLFATYIRDNATESVLPLISESLHLVGGQAFQPRSRVVCVCVGGKEGVMFAELSEIIAL